VRFRRRDPVVLRPRGQRLGEFARAGAEVEGDV
jgi:hypothetical protein